MKLSELKKALDKLQVPDKEAIIDLIDLKTEAEMEKVLSELRIVKWSVMALGLLITVIGIIIAIK